MKKIIVIVSNLAVLFFFNNNLSAQTICPCESNTILTGRELKVNGTSINVRTGPGISYEKVVNKKTTKILKKTVYVSIDDTVTVFEECTKDNWSKIRVIEPDYLSKSHQGWVASRFLRKKQQVVINGQKFSDWHHEFNLEITKVLASNRIRGCGAYKYRINLMNPNEFFVHCSRDYINWVPYLVSISQGTVKRK